MNKIIVYALLTCLGAINARKNVNKEHKITICHNVQHNPHTITIDESAWKSHKKHGDYLGECIESPTESPLYQTETEFPTTFPTTKPTEHQTNPPTRCPFDLQTKSPTLYPTEQTETPTLYPTEYPTESPTNMPSEYPTNFPTESPTKLCNIDVDLYVVMDISGSVRNVYQDMVIFIKQFVNTISPTKNVRVGIISFGRNVNMIVPMGSPGSTNTEICLKNIIKNCKPPTSYENTDIPRAFKYLIANELPKRRKHVSTNVLLISDGRPTKGELSDSFMESSTLELANKIKKMGINMYTIGLGDSENETFLKKIGKYILSIDNYNEVLIHIVHIINEVCKISAD